jgi:transcriptional regulator with XRE-family HTH domain
MSRNTRSARAADATVGTRIRLRRLEQGLSQTELGKRVGVTFQQVQKYENGANRVSASRLVMLAQTLEVPMSYFFPEGSDGPKTNGPDPAGLITDRDSFRLAQAYAKIKHKKLRKIVLDLAETLAQEPAPKRGK